MAVQMSNDQFQQLLATLQSPQQQAAQIQQIIEQLRLHQHKSAAALGPMKPLNMGLDRMQKLQRFNQWLEEAENRFQYLGCDADDEKLCLLRAWGGTELVSFMKVHAKVRLETTPATDTEPEKTKDTYNETVVKIRGVLQSFVNRTLAMHELLTTKQGNRPWLDFYKDIEEKAQNMSLNSTPYTHADAVKDALIMGMSDPWMIQRALSEDPDLDTIVKWGQAREASTEGALTLTASSAVLDTSDSLKDCLPETIHAEMSTANARKPSDSERQFVNVSINCRNCLTEHPPGRCPANGKECFGCGGMNHFERAGICSDDRGKVKRVYDEFAGCKPFTKSCKVRKISAHAAADISETKQTSKCVEIKVGGVKQKLLVDTGTNETVIPPSNYSQGMGELRKSDTVFTAWGSNRPLDVKGMVDTQLITHKGAATNSKVYIVDGYQPEAILGRKDAEALGIVSFNIMGRDQTEKINPHHLSGEMMPSGEPRKGSASFTRKSLYQTADSKIKQQRLGHQLFLSPSFPMKSIGHVRQVTEPKGMGHQEVERAVYNIRKFRRSMRPLEPDKNKYGFYTSPGYANAARW